MLTPEDMEGFKPEFEQIVWHLLVVLAPDMNRDLPEDEVMGHGIEALRRMENLVGEVHEKQGGQRIQEILKGAAEKVKSAEGAGVVGGLASAIASLSATGLGGFGVAAGGTAWRGLR